MKYIAIFSVLIYEHNGKLAVEKIEYMNGYSEADASYEAAVIVWRPMDGTKRLGSEVETWFVVEHEEDVS